MSAATQAQNAPKAFPTMVFLSAFPSPPEWKKQAHAMKPAQMSRPRLRYRMVAIPPSSPMLTDSATSCDIVMPPS
jgi:hypothetical protein